MITDFNDISEDLAKAIKYNGDLFAIEELGSDFEEHLLSNAINTFDHLANLANQRYFYNAGRELKFGIINSYRFNAFASVGKEKIDFIGINIGTIQLLSSIFTRLLSHELIFKTVGDPSIETRAGYSPYIPTVAAPDDFKPQKTNCSIRTAFAKHLALTALTVIFSHEISHIRKGHSHVKNAIKSKTRQPLTAIEYQAIELDADWGATELTLEHMDFIRNARSKCKVESNDALGISWRAFYEDPIETMRFVFFANYFPLRITSGDHWHPDTQRPIGQPLPPFRMGLLVLSYADLMESYCGLSNEQARAHAEQWCLEAEKAYADFQVPTGEGELDLTGIKAFFENGGNYLGTVHETLENMQSELSVYALPEVICPRPSEAHNSSYVALRGSQNGNPVLAILESKLCEKFSNSVNMQCFSLNRDGTSIFPFPIRYTSEFQGDPIAESLAYDGLNWVRMTGIIDNFEQVDLKEFKGEDPLLEWSFQHSTSAKLKCDILNLIRS